MIFFKKQNKQDAKKGGTREFISVFIQAIILALIIRTFIFQPFTIPSGSMRPTLLVGDYILVSKFSYGYSKYSLPFAPNIFSGRLFNRQPRRGDVVVFRPPNSPKIYFIKRLIGLPGDKVQIRQGVIYINGDPISRQRIGETRNVDFIGDLPLGNNGVLFDPLKYGPITVYREKMSNGVTYDTYGMDFITYNGQFSFDPNNTPVYTVAPHHYFMMGDNRNNSEDSRFNELGQIPEENLVGRANFIFFSIGNGASAWQIWKWPFDIRWNRLFSFVDTIKDVPANP